MVVNSSALRNATRRLASGFGERQHRRAGSPVSTSRTSVTSVFDRRISATVSGLVRTSRRLGCLISPARASSVSRSPYSAINCAAVFTPMPGAPGTLSVEIAGQRLNVDDLVGAAAKIGEHLRRRPIAPLFAIARRRIVHRNARLDELHQVLVGRDDQHVGALLSRLARVGRDEIVGLVAVLFDRRQAKGAHRIAHQRKLRDEISGRIGPMALVGGIDFLAERILRFVEDDRQMGRLDAGRAVAHELQQLGGEQANRADRQPVGTVIVFLILADRLEIGAKDEGRAVDQKNMVAGADRTVGLGHVGRIGDVPRERHRRRRRKQ